jgi:heme a synthase
MTNKRFAVLAWGVLGYNLLVILWGAVVRATGSGAGCGSHWPLCQGEVMPRSPQIETLIELSHRLTSGLALITVVLLVVAAVRTFPTGHFVRKGAWSALFFIFTEALLGAGLVLFKYVAFDQSVARAFWMAGHLVNTFLLLAALTLTAWGASNQQRWHWRGQGTVGWLLLVAWLALLLLGVSGAITALGDTLALRGGISPAESTLVAQLVALRIYHPLFAVLVGIILATIAWGVMTRRPGPATQQWGRLLIGIFVAQLLFGAINVALKAPVWMQILHLLAADLLWISLILLTASAFALADDTTATREAARMVEQPL